MSAIPASFRKISKSIIAHFAWLISVYAWYVYMFMCVLVHVYMTGIQHRATSFVNIYLKVSHWPWDSPIARLASTPSFSMSGASALAIEPSLEIPLKYFWLLYVCTCIHMRGDQRTTLGSGFSLPTVSSKDWTQVSMHVNQKHPAH